MKARKLTVATTLELDVEVETRVTPGTRDYFDRSFGNWLPGDPADVEVDSVTICGVSVPFDALPKDAQERIVEAVMDAAEDEARCAEADAADRAYDEWKDRRMGLD